MGVENLVLKKIKQKNLQIYYFKALN